MPRAAAPDAGLRGPARSWAPDPAREAARDLALDDVASVYSEEVVEVKGMATVEERMVLAGVPARIDPVGVRGGLGLVGDQLDEGSTHVVSLAPDISVTTRHRLVLDSTGDVKWAVTATRRTTDSVLTRVEVRQS